jgi:hypothetical protein
MQTTEQMILDIQAAANALKDEMETLISALTDDVTNYNGQADAIEEAADPDEEEPAEVAENREKAEMLEAVQGKVEDALTEVEFMADLDVSEIGL